MALLSGSKRATVADLMAVIADLQQQVIALQPTATVKPTKAKAAMPNFRTKAQRASGKGWPCTAPEPCGRRDLRTAGRAASHDMADGHSPTGGSNKK